MYRVIIYYLSSVICFAAANYSAIGVNNGPNDIGWSIIAPMEPHCYVVCIYDAFVILKDAS